MIIKTVRSDRWWLVLCHQIAFAANETGHTELLGVIYDELVRCKEDSFDYESVATSFCMLAGSIGKA